MNEAMNRFDRKMDAWRWRGAVIKVFALALWFFIVAVFWDAGT